MDDTSGSRTLWTAGLLGAAALSLFASAFAAMMEQLFTIFRYIPKDYNEGWNAYWAAAAWKGNVLYPPLDSAVVNNYPPISFYVVGALGRLIGDNIFAGRLVALGAFFGVAAGILCWLRGIGLSRVALLSAATFLAALAVYAPHYIAMNDPQLLGHAAMVAAGCVIWRGHFSSKALAYGVVLLLMGGLIKQLLVPLPLAITLWIAIFRRDRLVRWLACSVACGTIALFWLMLTNAGVLHGIDAARGYSTELARLAVVRITNNLPLVLLLGSLGCLYACLAPSRDENRRQFAIFVLLYLILAAAGGVLAATGLGVDSNAFFDLLIATSLAIGCGMDAVLARRGARATALLGVLLACLAVPVTRHAVSSLRANLNRLSVACATEAAYRAEIGHLKSAGSGRVACEILAVCYWAEQPFTVDFFNYGQKLRTNRPVDACERVFGEGSLTTLLLEAPRGAVFSSRLPASCNQIIERYFAPSRATSSGVVFERRS